MASPNISFDNIPTSIRKPGKYFEFNTRLAVRTLPNNKQNLLIIGQRLGAHVEPARWQGGTLDDLESGGTYTGSVKNTYFVKISTADTTDKFKWSKDYGVTWSEEVTVTGAAQELELGVTVSFGATTGHAADDTWHFGAWPAGAVAEKVATRVFSDGEAARFFGYGSQVHSMVAAAIRANPYVEITVIALDDASGSVVATGTVTITGPAVMSGTIRVNVGSQKVDVAIAAGDTATEIATAVCNAIANVDAMQVVAESAAGVITLTAKNKGSCGNDIAVSCQITNATGVSAAVVAMASGLTNPDPDDAFAVAFPDEYSVIAFPFTVSEDLVKLKTHLEAIGGPLEQRPGIGVFGLNGSLAAATTLAGQINSGHILVAYLRYTSATLGRHSPPHEIAAAMASVMCWEEDPARPLNTLELKGIASQDVADKFSRTEQETLLYNGVTPLETTNDLRVQIVRAISTYIHDAQGIDDVSLLDITTMRTLNYVRKACRERVALRFPREKLSSKTPPKVKSELLDVLMKLEELEIVEEVDANKDGLLVERDSVDVNRLNAKIPCDVVNGLHVFAGRIDLLL